MNRETVIISTGTANIASVRAAFLRLGQKPEVTSDAARVASAQRVVLPGVGHFEAAMRILREQGMVDVLTARIAAGEPTIGICLGMQMLAAASEESPGCAGLGIWPFVLRRFQNAPRIPQMGWNALSVDPGATILESGSAYFANTYALVEDEVGKELRNEGWKLAIGQYGKPYVGALERGAVVAFQCHPELSSGWGQRALQRWIDRSEAFYSTSAVDAQKGEP